MEENDTERLVSAHPTNEEDSSVPAAGHEQEEVVTSDHDEENSESMKAAEEPPVEEASISEPEQYSGHDVNNVTTDGDLDEKMNEVSEQPLSHEESVVFQINSNDDDELPRLHLETQERETTRPAPEEEEEEEEEAKEEESTTAPADIEDINYEECLQELHEERDKASQHSSQLQMKLAEFFHMVAWDDTQPEREMLVSEQLQEYEKYMKMLTDLRQQFITDSETAQQQAEDLRTQSQEKLDKVENEWRAFMALEQDVAVTVLSRFLGKKAALAKVESTQAAVQLRQDELIKLRLEQIKLSIRIRRLEAELHDEEERTRDPIHLQVERLKAERLEKIKHTEKQNKESFKLEKKISSNLKRLSNVKEKLNWSQMQVQAQRKQLAELEATVARKRDLLSRTKQARNGLQRDNLRLKERSGLLGNRVLLRDFEDTVDACDHLEEKLENLKCRQAEMVFSCGRRKNKLETI